MGAHRVFADGTDLAAVAQFRREGWVQVRRPGAEALAARLQAWADDVARWPDDGGGWLAYRELTDAGPALCRTENLAPHHHGLRALLCTGTLPAEAGALLGEAAVLYKDKLKHKLPIELEEWEMEGKSRRDASPRARRGLDPLLVVGDPPTTG